MQKRLSVAVVCVLGAAPLLAQDSSFWLKVGSAYRGRMEARVSGSSYVQEEGLHAASPLNSFPGNLVQKGKAGANTDDITAYGNRKFDDGYVNMDGGTGNPNSIDPALTWFWGYENASQYDAGANRLTFHRVTTESGQNSRAGSGRVVTLTTLQDDPVDVGAAFCGGGAELVLGYPLRTTGAFRVDICGGFMSILDAEANAASSTFEEQIRDDRYAVGDTYRYTDRITDTYTYDTTGVALPNAPHHGTYDGPFDSPPVIPSPIIPNRPSSVNRASTRTDSISRDTRLTSSSTWSARNDVNIAVETDIHELWFGPRLALQPTDWLALNITPRLSLNYVSTGVQRSETFLAVHADGSVESLDSWHDHAGKAKLMLGAGVTAGVDINIGGGFFAGIWGGYERVSGDFNINVGPNAVSLDLTGYTAGAAVGFCFGGGVRPATTSALGDLLEGVDVEAPVKSVLATARGGVNTAVSATAEVARVPASPPSSDAPGKPQVEVVSLGEDVYKKLDHLLNTSNDPEMVRRVIGYIKKNEPTMYAALTKYVEQKKSLSTQTAGRAAANMAAIPTEAVKAPRSVAEPQLSVAGVQSGTVRGECVYRKLDNLLKTGNAADMVRRAIETVKQHQPDDYAALLAYVEQKKIERLQLAKR